MTILKYILHYALPKNIFNRFDQCEYDSYETTKTFYTYLLKTILDMYLTI